LEHAFLSRVFQASRVKREAGMEGKLRAFSAPRLTRACLRSPEKRQKNNNNNNNACSAK